VKRPEVKTSGAQLRGWAKILVPRRNLWVTQ
jgi:hypothetical protein